MVQQKVIKVGNSLAVTLPKDFVKAADIKAGQGVFVESDSNKKTLQVSTEQEFQSKVTPEFKRWLDEFIDEYGDALKELAKK